MKRRDVLRFTAFASGTAIFAPLASSILSGCVQQTAENGTSVSYAAFDENQYSLLTSITDTILPRTDTPSASDVGVPGIIDNVVGEVYPADEKQKFMTGFNLLDEYLKTRGFIDADSEEKKSILLDIETGDVVPPEVRENYLHLKQQTIAFYLTSEEIGENVLNYLPVPGAYEPCISLQEVGGKRWSL